MKFVTILAVCAAGLSTAVVAQTERELDAHEHGSAALNVALDENKLYIELESPWNNLIGFEHAPTTDEQKALVEDSLALLNDPLQLFEFVGSDCRVDKVMVESSLSHNDHNDHNDHDDHDKHDDDKEHDDHDKNDDHEEHDDHDKEHDDHAENDKHEHDEHHDDHADSEDTHSSVLAAYEFTCANGADLAAINVVFLKRWTGFEELDVQLIGPAAQALVELNAQQMTIDLKQVQ